MKKTVCRVVHVTRSTHDQFGLHKLLRSCDCLTGSIIHKLLVFCLESLGKAFSKEFRDSESSEIQGTSVL